MRTYTLVTPNEKEYFDAVERCICERIEKGLSRSDVAYALGITQQSIYNFEKKERVNYNILIPYMILVCGNLKNLERTMKVIELGL